MTRDAILATAPVPAALSLNPHIEADLQLLNEALAYRAWLFDVVGPHLDQRILEIGAGIGNYTEKLLDREMVWATDYADSYVERLENRFGDRAHIVAASLDLTRVTTAQKATLVEQRFDTVLMMNVLEHIDDDLQAISDMRDCLVDGGRLVIVVPAMQRIFGALDRAYGHFRRYGREDFDERAEGSGMRLVHCGYFNVLGVIGWWVAGRLHRRQYLPRRQTRLFNAITPVLRTIERIAPPPWGLSLVAVLKKEKASR